LGSAGGASSWIRSAEVVRLPAEPLPHPGRPQKGHRLVPAPPVDQPVEGEAHAVDLLVEVELPGALLGRAEPGLGLLSGRNVEARERLGRRIEVASRLQPLEGEVSNHREHGEARGRPRNAVDHALVEQRGKQLDNVRRRRQSCDALSGLDREAATEDAQAQEQLLLERAKQLEAPRDRRLERLLPGRRVARSGQGQPVAQAREQLLGAQQTESRCGQLDRERHPFETAADLGDDRRVLGLQVE